MAALKEGPQQPFAEDLEYIYIELSGPEDREKMITYLNKFGRIYECMAEFLDQKKPFSPEKFLYSFKVNQLIRSTLQNDKNFNYSEGKFVPGPRWFQLFQDLQINDELSQAKPTLFSEFLIRGVHKDLAISELELLLTPIFGTANKTLKKLKVNLWVGLTNQLSKTLRNYKAVFESSFQFSLESIKLRIPGKEDIIEIIPVREQVMGQWPFLPGEALTQGEKKAPKIVGRLKKKLIELEEDQNLDFQDSEGNPKEMKGCEKPTSTAYYNNKTSFRTTRWSAQVENPHKYRFNVIQSQKIASKK